MLEVMANQLLFTVFCSAVNFTFKNYGKFVKFILAHVAFLNLQKIVYKT